MTGFTEAPRPLRRTSLALAALAALAAAGCAAHAPPRRIIFPPPPDQGRIEYVRTVRFPGDIQRGFWQSMRAVVLPGDAALAIAQPTGLALSPDEKTLYVSANAPGTVIAIDVENGAFRKVADTGRPPKMAFAVATDADGNIYVTDHSEAGSVVVYGPDGKTFLRRVGEGKLERPGGLAIDRRRQVLYVACGSSVESQNHRVEVFSLKGEHIRTIGTRGDAPGTFNFPANLAVGRDGSMYVVDMMNFRVQVFDPDGQVIGTFGRIGAGDIGAFNKAKGIALDAFDNIYVTDGEQAWVQIFNQKHQPLMKFSGRGEVPGFMLNPGAITISSKNRIYIADFAGHAIHEFQLINTTAADSYNDEPAKPADKAGEKAGGKSVPAAAPGQIPQGG